MVILQETDSNQEYQSLVFLGEYEQKFCQSVLYFCPFTVFQHLKLPEKLSVILYSEEAPSKEYLCGHTANAAYFSDRAAFTGCYNQLCSDFQLIYRMDGCMQSLSALICANASLTEIADKIAGIYSHPVNIVNNSFSILASSTAYPFFSADLISDNQRGYVPPDIIRLIDIPALRIGKSSREPMLIFHKKAQLPPEAEEFKHYCTPILISSVIVGYFSVYLRPEEYLPETLIRYLPQIANQISLQMQKQDFYTINKANYYTNLFSNLLSENCDPNGKWEERICAFGYQLKDIKYILVADIPKSIRDSYGIQELSKALQSIFENSIFIIQNSQIIYLASYDDCSNPLKTILAKCAEFMDSMILKVGISSSFTSIDGVREHTMQARAAIEVGEIFDPQINVYPYDRYRLKYMVYKLSSKFDISMFCLPQLTTLLDYDKKHNSQLTYTLFIHLSNPHTPASACKRLHIHKNTLYFRLDKIKEITGLDFDDPSISAMLLVSFMILRLRHAINWSMPDLI
ncbi:PucR family transcriptional regulator [Caproicibacter sp. BJN0012]|uniref:PucR family transcriptional regulator n=1 Tax=Caproicibacter sp. BJN0012 TaxID=3110227 RepID=UPI002E138D48